MEKLRVKYKAAKLYNECIAHTLIRYPNHKLDRLFCLKYTIIYFPGTAPSGKIWNIGAQSFWRLYMLNKETNGHVEVLNSIEKGPIAISTSDGELFSASTSFGRRLDKFRKGKEAINGAITAGSCTHTGWDS